MVGVFRAKICLLSFYSIIAARSLGLANSRAPRPPPLPTFQEDVDVEAISVAGNSLLIF